MSFNIKKTDIYIILEGLPVIFDGYMYMDSLYWRFISLIFQTTLGKRVQNIKKILPITPIVKEFNKKKIHLIQKMRFSSVRQDCLQYIS